MNTKKEFAAYERLVKRDNAALKSFSGGQLLTLGSPLYKKMIAKPPKKRK